MAENRPLDELLADLPPGEWVTTLFRGTVVAACPQHRPHVLVDGKWVELSPTFGDTVMVDPPTTLT